MLIYNKLTLHSVIMLHISNAISQAQGGVNMLERWMKETYQSQRTRHKERSRTQKEIF